MMMSTCLIDLCLKNYCDNSSAFNILNGSSFLQIRKTTTKAWVKLNFVKYPSPIMELAPLEHLKN